MKASEAEMPALAEIIAEAEAEAAEPISKPTRSRVGQIGCRKSAPVQRTAPRPKQYVFD